MWPWDQITKIGTPISLIAFVVAIVFYYLQSRLKNKLDLIKSAPASERQALIDSELDSFSIDANSLTREQKYDLLKRKLDSRTQRFRSTLNVSMVLSLAVIVALFQSNYPFISQVTSVSAKPEWIAVINGQIPHGAFQGGSEADGSPIYIARVKHEGGVHIGKARPGDAEAAIPFGGKEIWLPNYEVYIGKGHWDSVTYKTPDSAVEGGCENNSTPLYIARAYIDGGWHIGKIRKDATQAFIPYGGQEKIESQYQLLVK
jgi:hypothetical protein